MRELIVDSFAGGGGASTGIEMACRSPDIAINHDEEALCLHAANHPHTQHLSKNIWQVDPLDVIDGRPVGLLWASPDCKHFSKAKGGKPVKRNIRDLAWIVVTWAERAKPRVIILENVEEFQDWCPLNEDGTPDRERLGETFRKWKRKLQSLGYRVELRELRGCDYGSPTIRKRLFIIMRRDGEEIVWPEPTHGPASDPLVIAGLKKPWRAAAEIIDWSLPCPSIFLSAAEGKAIGVRRPLVEATMARIAKGIDRYVLKAAKPFIVSFTHQGGDRNESINEPVKTVTCAPRGEKGLVMPYLVPRYGERTGQEPRTMTVDAPMPTVVPTANGGSLCAAFLAQHNLGMVGHDVRRPVSTITAHPQQAVVSAGLVTIKGTDRRGSSVLGPVPGLCAQGNHVAEVRAFLIKYFGTDQDPEITEPLHTITTRDRFGLVTVQGQLYQIADIGMRMLSPRELFRAQGFPDGYIIDPLHNGVRLSKTAQIRMCGNSVCPQIADALVRANYDERVRSMPSFDLGDLEAAA